VASVAPWRTRVAVDADQVLGAATRGPNQSGPGSHISNANFVVSSEARGRGVGTALVEDTLSRARAEGYAGMQFNAVTETNPAVALYQRFGFEIIGTVPGAFIHPTKGPVGLHVMYLPL
jgi:ribosomal protein S18 acetylase RimI-like enzyme